PDRQHVRRRLDAGRDAQARRENLPRRLRHRLLVAELPAALPHRRGEDRPLLREPYGRERRGLRDREGDRDTGPEPEDEGDRRRDRDAGPAGGPAEPEVQLRPGLALLQAGLPRRRQRAPPAGNPLVSPTPNHESRHVIRPRHFFLPKIAMCCQGSVPTVLTCDRPTTAISFLICSSDILWTSLIGTFGSSLRYSTRATRPSGLSAFRI